VAQLGNAQTVINELTSKLRAKDELLKLKISEAKHEYTRLMEGGGQFSSRPGCENYSENRRLAYIWALMIRTEPECVRKREN
jgi:hypothetical protein